MWCFETPVILILGLYTSLCASQVTLELCEAPIKDDICVLQCITPDLTQSVVFEKDNTEYASCKYILGTLSCTSIYPRRYLISQQSSPTVVTLLNITQLSRADDEGSWTCDYGSTGSSAHDLTVLTAPKQTSTSGNANIDYCGGNNSATYDVTLTVTCSSAVSVSAELSSPTTGAYYTESLAVVRGNACPDGAESIYAAVFTITSTTGSLVGFDYRLTFKTHLYTGVGEVYDDVFASNVTFTCPETTTPPTKPPATTKWDTPPRQPSATTKWDTPPTQPSATTKWDTPPTQPSATTKWDTPPTQPSATTKWDTQPTQPSATTKWDTPPTQPSATTKWDTPPTQPSATTKWDTPPTQPSATTKWDTPPTQPSATTMWSTPPRQPSATTKWGSSVLYIIIGLMCSLLQFLQ